MLFNSFEFLVFFPLVTALYFLLPHQFRWLLLLLASCVFYSYFIPVYILILFFTIVIDYYAGIYIEKVECKKRKQFLILSLVANIGVLAVFKYYNFFIQNINDMGSALGLNYHVGLLNIILPIGLSFHTFQAMSYTIEVYRGNQKAEKHFGIYALYVMFYPQLVAGPIERPQNVLHQFHEVKTFNRTLFISGIRLMLWGLFKKVVISDRLAIYVNMIYAHPEQYHYINLLITVVLFSFQIYCDFSGYSDIAIGSAKTMGYDLMTNFNRPYFAKNIQEFWAKWHISLSTWFRDYVYFPLGGNRKGKTRTYVNVAIIFLLSGLWHGANWTFVIWGALHAMFMVLFLIVKDHRFLPQTSNVLMKWISVSFTFCLVSLAWVYFRAENIGQANSFLGYIVNRNAPAPFADYLVDTNLKFIFNKFSFALSIGSIILLMILERRMKPNMLELNDRNRTDIALNVFLLVMILVFGVFKSTSFIYFQF